VLERNRPLFCDKDNDFLRGIHHYFCPLKSRDGNFIYLKLFGGKNSIRTVKKSWLKFSDPSN
jgi:hypothetical protein